MRINSSGNIGIGTTSPDQLIHINKTSGTTLFKASVAGNSTIGLEIVKTGATTQSWRIADGQTVNGKLEFYDVTDSATRMCIDGAGNIGIGTTSRESSTKLQIKTPQSGTAAGTGMTISGWNGSAESRVQFMSYGIGDGTLAIRIGTSNTERLRVASAGQIGISGANYGTSGQVLTSGGSSSAPSWADAAGGGATPTVKTANYTASSGDMVVVNGTGLTITLPSSPSTGDSVAIRILGDRYATIARNSSNIESTASNFYVDIFDGYVTFTYSDSTRGWLIGG